MFEFALYFIPAALGTAMVLLAVHFLPIAGMRRLVSLATGISFFATPFLVGGHGIVAVSPATMMFVVFWTGAPPAPGEVISLLAVWTAGALTLGLVLYFRFPRFALLRGNDRDAA